MSHTEEHITFSKTVITAETERDSDPEPKPEPETELEIKPKPETKTNLGTKQKTESKSKQQTYLVKHKITSNATAQDDSISAQMSKQQKMPKLDNDSFTDIEKKHFEVNTKIPETQNNMATSLNNRPTSTSMASQRNTVTRENKPFPHDWSSSSSYNDIHNYRSKEIENSEGPEITNELRNAKRTEQTSGDISYDFTSLPPSQPRPHPSPPISHTPVMGSIDSINYMDYLALLSHLDSMQPPKPPTRDYSIVATKSRSSIENKNKNRSLSLSCLQWDPNIISKVRPVEETVSMTDVVSGEKPNIYGDAPPPPDHLG